MVWNDALQDLISFFLQDFILEHYSEDSSLYEDEIADLMDLRQVRRCVQRGGGPPEPAVSSGWLEVIGRRFQNPLCTLAHLGQDSGTPEPTPAPSTLPSAQGSSSGGGGGGPADTACATSGVAVCCVLTCYPPTPPRCFLSLQACRTPSRDEAGVELLTTYFNQLGFVESRFFPPTRQMGILFTW